MPIETQYRVVCEKCNACAGSRDTKQTAAQQALDENFESRGHPAHSHWFCETCGPDVPRIPVTKQVILDLCIVWELDPFSFTVNAYSGILFKCKVIDGRIWAVESHAGPSALFSVMPSHVRQDIFKWVTDCTGLSPSP